MSTQTLHALLEAIHGEASESTALRMSDLHLDEKQQQHATTPTMRLFREAVDSSVSGIAARIPSFGGAYQGPRDFRARFTWRDPYSISIKWDDGRRTLEQQYRWFFRVESPLVERVLVRGPEEAFLLSQHVQVSAADAAAAEKRARLFVWWPRLRLLLIATRAGEEAHGGLEKLGQDQVALIAEFVLGSRQDSRN